MPKSVTELHIEAIREMIVPKVNEASEYSDGYSDALDDIVEMLEAHEAEVAAGKQHTGNFV